MTARPLVLLALALSMIASASFAAGVGVGEALPELTLDDASGKPHTLVPELRRIYTTADRSGDKLIKAAMDGLKQANLDAQGATVIADISGAPFFIKGIIRSNLRERGYTTWLDSSGDTRKILAYRENRVAIIELDQLKVTAIRYVSTVEDLKRELIGSP